MLFYHLSKSVGLLKALALDELKLCNFLRRMEAGYDPTNPYHNRSAAAQDPWQVVDVLSMHEGAICCAYTTQLIVHCIRSPLQFYDDKQHVRQ